MTKIKPNWSVRGGPAERDTDRERMGGRAHSQKENGRIFKEKEEQLKEVELEGNRKSAYRL